MEFKESQEIKLRGDLKNHLSILKHHRSPKTLQRVNLLCDLPHYQAFAFQKKVL